ncbi:MAG: hypothetical protein K0B15_10515 [Lentimicrobium sp.]|nr:hypothetical protein [Lentimicrobium sp.]
MATRILLVSLFLSLLVACDKKEDDNNPGRSYTGTLALEYSRSFPTFISSLTIPVDISPLGEVTVVQPDPVAFQGEADKMIDGDRIRIREEGTINISDIRAKWLKKEGLQYLEVSLSFDLSGNQSVWKWDAYYWLKQSEAPYSLLDPVECPMMFRIDNAVLSEALCAARCNDCWGYNDFRWRLVLTAFD